MLMDDLKRPVEPVNPSGLKPLEFNLILKQEDVGAKTPGGLWKPETLAEKEKHGATKGTIVALSPLAFNEDILPVDVRRPQPGDRVLFARHAGVLVKGEDGEEYRIIKDKDVVAVIGEPSHG